MIVGYTYKSKPMYVKHLKELILKGYDFPSSNNIGVYINYYDEYEDFVLLVDDRKELLYGSVSNTVNKEIREYGAKRTNINNY